MQWVGLRAHTVGGVTKYRIVTSLEGTNSLKCRDLRKHPQHNKHFRGSQVCLMDGATKEEEP